MEHDFVLTEEQINALTQQLLNQQQVAGSQTGALDAVVAAADPTTTILTYLLSFSEHTSTPLLIGAVILLVRHWKKVRSLFLAGEEINKTNGQVLAKCMSIETKQKALTKRILALELVHDKLDIIHQKLDRLSKKVNRKS